MSDLPGPPLSLLVAVVDVLLVDVLDLSAFGSLATPDTHWPIPLCPWPVSALVEVVDESFLQDDTAEVTASPWLVASDRLDVWEVVESSDRSSLTDAVEPAEVSEPDEAPAATWAVVPPPGWIATTTAAVPPAAANAASAIPVTNFVPTAIGSPDRTGRRRRRPWRRAWSAR